MKGRHKVDHKPHPVDLSLDNVAVMYHGEKVGTLALTNSQVLAFEYDPDWLIRRRAAENPHRN